MKWIKGLADATLERAGHPTTNFEKRTYKQQQSMNKIFWSHFKHSGRLLGKMYLFLTPYSQQDWWKSSKPARCTYNPQPDLLGSHPQTYVQTLLASLGVVMGQNKAIRWWGRAGCWIGNWVWEGPTNCCAASYVHYVQYCVNKNHIQSSKCL